jgi:transketolase
VIDHHTYTFLGDGCLMEGVSHEACSLAGTLGIGKLIAFYDDNGISIDGEVEGWFTDDTPKRFEAYGWQVIPAIDGHDADALFAAIEAAKANTDQPTLICCKTIIGFGSPNKEGKEDCHGAPLGADEITLTRKELGWTYGAFDIPADIYEEWNAVDAGDDAEQIWNRAFSAYHQAHPELAAELLRRVAGDLPADFEAQAQTYVEQLQAEGSNLASRKASQNTINAFGPLLPELLGGSADLAGSNLTKWSGSKGITKTDASGNYVYYGVREFAMSAMMNGMALHGGFIPYGATFLVFMEYARNAVRMAALMKQQSIFVYTHDSIGLGEDGPTHQPVEQLSALRATPNLHTWRPCDTVESAVSWKSAIERRDGPAALVFSRQGLKPMPRTPQQVADIGRGGYVLKDCAAPQAILIATGSEVELAVNAADELAGKGIQVRVVSMPCAEIFSAQDADYRDSVLTPTIRARVAVEALHADYWFKFVGLDGRVVGMRTFGESAPGDQLLKEFGFTVDNVVANVMEAIG